MNLLKLLGPAKKPAARAVVSRGVSLLPILVVGAVFFVLVGAVGLFLRTTRMPEKK